MINNICACLIVGVICFILGEIFDWNLFIPHGKKDADNNKDSNGSNGTDSTSDTARTNSSLILGEDHDIGRIAVKCLLDDKRAIIRIHKYGRHLKSTPLGADNPEVECVIYKDGNIYYTSNDGDLHSYDSDLCYFDMTDRAGHFNSYSEMLPYSVSDSNAEVGKITKIFAIDSFFCYKDEIDDALYLLHKKFDYGESPFIEK